MEATGQGVHGLRRLLLASELRVGPEGKAGPLPALGLCLPGGNSSGVCLLCSGDGCLCGLGPAPLGTAVCPRSRFLRSCPSHGLACLGYLHLSVFPVYTYHKNFVESLFKGLGTSFLF